ncbi:acVLRF1 family peptidyl-tRNA hydrolase [Nocardioides dongkuii]|uniref:acVLRF1 family peptidyl-tRNA hydrolase n=1 Tax=Nocardioides dongkuii TaxID=2760089 RepID=UPI0015FAABFD|nr:acVLRF1 family peptidyl-tRNA hydrolase [Nocardioides dongkuii]
MTSVLVPAARFERWVLNFRGRHGETGLTVVDGALAGAADDGSTFTARLPFAAAYDGLPDAAGFAAGVVAPGDWGLLLVRKGGFAVARLAGVQTVASKVGQRHVQGRTKAGGQSQQRFARRRDNQARQAYEAAADHAARLLEGLRGPVVAGGDRPAVEEVLEDPRLRHLAVLDPWLPVPDPRRAVLEQALVDACSVQVVVTNADAS